VTDFELFTEACSEIRYRRLYIVGNLLGLVSGFAVGVDVLGNY
jgi:hypothetical protein